MSFVSTIYTKSSWVGIDACFHIFFLLSFTVNGQQLRFQHLGVNQGLSQSSVYGIYQDSKGFMWFATADGLNRYDGNSLKIYRAPSELYIRGTGNFFGKGMVETNDGNIGSYKMAHGNNQGLLYTQPYVVRGELCISKSILDKRIIGMIGYDPGNNSRTQYASLRLEFPLGNNGRWWLFGQATQIQGSTVDNFQLGKVYTASFSQYNIGFRIQNAIL